MCMAIGRTPIYPEQVVALLDYLHQQGKITKEEANELYHHMFDNKSGSFEKETAYIHEKN